MANYVIKKGDNLTKIAKKYGTTVDALVKANNIKNKNLIITGRTLNIPGKAVSQSRATRTATKATADKGPGRSYTKEYMDSKRNKPKGKSAGDYARSAYNMASGKTAKDKGRQTVLQKAGVNTTAIAGAMVPTGKAIQGVKTLAGAAKYGKVVSRNLNKMQAGYTKGIVSKGELDQAKKLAEMVAKRKQQLKAGPKPTQAQLEKSIPSKFTQRPKEFPAKPKAQPKPKPKPKETVKPKVSPKPKGSTKPTTSKTQQQANEMLNRTLGKKPVRRVVKYGVGGAVLKNFIEDK